MRKAPLLSIVLWSAVGCGGSSGFPDAGMPGTDLVQGGALAFGDADCGATPAAQTLTFHNTGTSELTWSAQINGAGFTISAGASGTVAPGAQAAITVAADQVPGTASVGVPIAATLIVTTNISDTPFMAGLSVTPHGGSLRIGTPTIGFGQVQLTTPVTQALEISNTGDRAVQVALVAPADADFTATWTGAPTAADVGPGASLEGASAGFQPSSAAIKSDALAIAATGPLCAGDAASIALGGEGTAAQVSVTPGTLQFGATSCGATAATQLVTIQNDYAFAINYTAAITAGPYTITAGQATGTVPANGTATIAVKAAAVPKAATSLVTDALTGTMTVTTDAPAATPASLTMAQTASGAVLALTPAPGATIAFGDVIAGTPEAQSYAVANTGNASAAVTVAVTGSGYTAAAPSGGVVPPTGVDVTGSVTQTVAQRGALTGTLTLATTTPLCQAAAPGAINLSAIGKAPIATIGSAPAMTSTCGVATPATVAVSIQNTGDAPLVITSGSATNSFTLTTALPITIQPGATTSLAVRPPVAVVNTDTAGATKTGTLSLVTNEIGTPTRTVSLSTTVSGAVLAVTPAPGNTLAFGDVNAGTPESLAYSVTNSGNLAAAVAVAVTGSGFSATTPGGGTVPATGAATGASVTQTVAAHGNLTGSLTVSSTTAQCTTGPGAVSLSAFGRTPTAVVGTAAAMQASCGAASATAVDVSIQNAGDAPLVINASATGGFTVMNTLPLTVPVGGSTTISIKPPLAVIGTYVGGTVKTGTLTITTNEVAGATHTVALSSTVQGANLSLATAFNGGVPLSTMAFTATQACPGGQTVYVLNTGNQPANVTISTPNFQLFKFGGFSPSSTLSAGGGASHAIGVWTVNNACTGTEAVQYQATGTICTSLPLTLTATFNIGGQASCFCT